MIGSFKLFVAKIQDIANLLFPISGVVQVPAVFKLYVIKLVPTFIGNCVAISFFQEVPDR